MRGLKIKPSFHSTKRWIRNICSSPVWILLLSLFLYGCSANDGQKQPFVEKGILDLREWDFETDGIVKLEGTWEFYWQKQLFPVDFVQQPHLKPDGWIPTPAIWNDVTISGSRLSGKGFGTYRLRIRLNPKYAVEREDTRTSSSSRVIKNQDFQVGLMNRSVETAFTVYVNGVKAGSSGRVGRSAQSSIPAYKPQLIRIPLSTDQLEIIVQISNFHHRKGGIDYVLRLGEYQDLLLKQKKGIVTDIFVFGSILIMGVYHFGLFLLRRKDRSTLYFGVLCLSLALRTIVSNDCQFLTFFPNTDFRLFLILDYASFTIALPSVVLFFYSLFPEEVNKNVTQGIVGISIIYLLFVFVTPPVIFSESVKPFQVLILFSAAFLLIALVRAIRRKRSESVYALLGGLLLLAASINDILHNNLIIRTAILIQFGVLGMILMQAFLLSLRFSKAFVEVESLKNSLENKVSERTADLKDALERINQQSHEQKELLHILCHDLANPFVSLSSLLELAEEDISIFEELGGIMQISVDSGLDTINLVRQMRALEDKSDSLIVQKENLLLMVNDSAAILDNRFTEKQITLVIDVNSKHDVLVEKTSFVNSVLNNIFSNAIKFSVPGDKIVVRSSKENGSITLSIRDQGIGMSPSLVRDLFDFSKTTSRQGTSGEKGTGFGMPLVKKFVEVYQGKLEIKSIEKKEDSTDHGTEINIYLKEV